MALIISIVFEAVCAIVFFAFMGWLAVDIIREQNRIREEERIVEYTLNMIHAEIKDRH